MHFPNDGDAAGVQILVVSALSDKVTASHAIKRGAHGFLQKPLMGHAHVIPRRADSFPFMLPLTWHGFEASLIVHRAAQT